MTSMDQQQEFKASIEDLPVHPEHEAAFDRAACEDHPGSYRSDLYRLAYANCPGDGDTCYACACEEGGDLVPCDAGPTTCDDQHHKEGTPQ